MVEDLRPSNPFSMDPKPQETPCLLEKRRAERFTNGQKTAGSSAGRGNHAAPTQSLVSSGVASGLRPLAAMIERAAAFDLGDVEACDAVREAMALAARHEA